MEVLSFGDFVKLFQLYYNFYLDKKSNVIVNLLWPLKFIRNASAHNNCLLNILRKPYMHTHLFNDKRNIIEPNKELVSLLIKVPCISKNTRKKKLVNPIIHDFVASLFLFNEICSSQILKEKQFLNLKKLMDERFCIHKDYFINDNVFTTNYEFVKKLLTIYIDNAYNISKDKNESFMWDNASVVPLFYIYNHLIPNLRFFDFK
ncbi:Abi family protein [Allocoprobacillus halotolerans]|uniref:Abi family protein n=1 Tax=Allocoprobacillus halotolerans TaxID=2944914 RepID=A0ABY5I6F2_9FIRM|nr:Abi family protein [Allocoprobacillus halotolerans]